MLTNIVIVIFVQCYLLNQITILFFGSQNASAILCKCESKLIKLIGNIAVIFHIEIKIFI